MFEGGSAEIQRIFESAGLTGVLPIAFPGAAHPSTSPGGGPDHDWTANPTHPHHAVPYIGIPRRGYTAAVPRLDRHLVVGDRPVLGLER